MVPGSPSGRFCETRVMPLVIVVCIGANRRRGLQEGDHAPGAPFPDAVFVAVGTFHFRARWDFLDS